MTLVMAIACGVAAADIYHNQPMLGIMEAASGLRISQAFKHSAPDFADVMPALRMLGRPA